MLDALVALTPFYISLFWALYFLLRGRLASSSHRLLGSFMASSAGLFLMHGFFYLEAYALYLALDPLYSLTSLSSYPLMYWYIRALTCEPVLRWRNLWHFVPAVTVALVLGALHLAGGEAERWRYLQRLLLDNDFSLVWDRGPAAWMARVYLLSRLFFAVQVFYYLLRAWRLVGAYEQRLLSFYSELKGRRLSWVKFLTLILIGGSLTSTLSNLVGRGYFASDHLALLLPSLAFSLVLFMVGYMGSMQRYSIQDVVLDEETNDREAAGDPTGRQSSAGSIGFSGRERLRRGLLRLMEEEALFKQADLRISDVSQRLRTNRTYLSNLINEEFGESFNVFVNRYRIQHACRLMARSEYRSYALAHLAELCGFGSVSSFNRAFKYFEGITPSQYLQARE